MEILADLRKERDSNPRYVFTYVSLAVRCFRPLSHPSEKHPTSIGAEIDVSQRYSHYGFTTEILEKVCREYASQQEKFPRTKMFLEVSLFYFFPYSRLGWCKF